MKARSSVFFAMLLGCGGSNPPPEPPLAAKPAVTAEPATTVSSVASAVAATSTPERPTAPSPPTAVNTWGGPGMELATPESVLIDDSGLVLISNINGKPLDADNNGFISAYAGATGKVNSHKWIEGGKNKVTLNAPKGMAIAKGVLYVADIDTVRLFDSKSGAPKGDLKIAGATFLNDVAAGPDGKIYVSDSGLKASDKGFEGTGTDAVYVLEGGKSRAIAKSSDLGRPNGLVATDKGIWVNTFGSGEIYRLDAKGQKQDVMKPPAGALDGLALVGDTLYVSSWESGSVYRAKIGGTFETVLTGLKAPADFAFDKKNSWLVVPWFMDSKVEAYAVK